MGELREELEKRGTAEIVNTERYLHVRMRTGKTVKILITERDLREQVRDLAKLFGWRMYFSWTSLHSPKGFPDLVLACKARERVVYAELKAEKGKVTDSQREWLDELAACGQEVYLWRPADFEEIARVLRSRLPCPSTTSWNYIRGKAQKSQGRVHA